MADIEKQAAFLVSIFDQPNDITPRLIFADWLDEQGEYDWAELIRFECTADLTIEENQLRQKQIVRDFYKIDWQPEVFQIENSTQSAVDLSRDYSKRRFGFFETNVIAASVDQLSNEEEFFRYAVLKRPEWFGANTLLISNGQIFDALVFDTILRSKVTRRVNSLVISGKECAVPNTNEIEQSEISLAMDFRVTPILSLQGLEALTRHRFASRLISLDVTNNDLGNDALRLIARSPMLEHLKNLSLTYGNRFRGRVFQEIYERFGNGVVS